MPAQEQVALVTGGGRGIGRAIALSLAASGYALALVARSQNELDETAALIKGLGLAWPPRVMVRVCDVTQASHIAEAIDAIHGSLGSISRLVNNAGVVRRLALSEMSEADFDQVLDGNLKSTYLMSRAALSDLRVNKGRIVNIASISATLGTPLLSAYCAAKAGVVGFTRALAEELRPDGVLAFSVLPGSVDTRMLREGVPGVEPAMSPADVASVVRYLCDAAPAAMSGSAVEVFGD